MSAAASAGKFEVDRGTRRAGEIHPLETAVARAHVTCAMPSLRLRYRRPVLAAAAVRFGLTLLGLLISGTNMAQESSLSAPLVVKDLQSGFAGETGRVWTISPDGGYTVARQIGLKVLEPDQQGRLTPEQWARLKTLLDQMAAMALPRQLGGAPQVNARLITLSYGGRESVLNLPPGGGDPNAPRIAAGSDPARLMLELADNVKAMTGG
jgi:hypothetical protein